MTGRELRQAARGLRQVDADAARRSRALSAALRPRLLALGLAAAAVFAADTAWAVHHAHLAWDVPVTRAVQAVDWGPVAAAFGWVDWLEGVRQVAAAVAGILLVLLVNRRAVPLLVVAALSGSAYGVTEALIRRPRPPDDLVHVVHHTAQFSYPSGHAVFFTWFVTLLVLAVVRPHLPRAATWAGWLLAAVVLALVCVGRVWAGEHWPSDVVGGLALGVAWTSLALSVRRLSDPALEPREGKGPGARVRGPARLWG